MKSTKQNIEIISVILVLLVILSLFIILILSGNLNIVTGKTTYDYDHSWTKAVCNETHCQDYEFFCDGNELIRQIPITGAVIEMPEDWIDPRNETDMNRICNRDTF